MSRNKWSSFSLMMLLMLFLTGLFLVLYPSIQGAVVDRRMGWEVDSFLSRLEDGPDKDIPTVIVPSTEPEESRPYPELWESMTAYNQRIYADGQSRVIRENLTLAARISDSVMVRTSSLDFTIHIRFFRIWTLRFWRRRLWPGLVRRFINDILHIHDLALAVPDTVADNVPRLLQFPEDRTNAVGPLLADRRQPSCGIVPLLREGQHHGQQMYNVFRNRWCGAY